MMFILEFMEAISPILDIVIRLLALTFLVFAISLLWRIWCVFGQASEFFTILRFNTGRFRETLVQIERFCRKYASMDFK